MMTPTNLLVSTLRSVYQTETAAGLSHEAAMAEVHAEAREAIGKKQNLSGLAGTIAREIMYKSYQEYVRKLQDSQPFDSPK